MSRPIQGPACTIPRQILTWMSHVAHMNESRRTHEWVTSHTWMGHVIHTRRPPQSQPQPRQILTWMSHVTRMKESCHTHTQTSSIFQTPQSQAGPAQTPAKFLRELVSSYIWSSHVTHTQTSSIPQTPPNSPTNQKPCPHKRNSKQEKSFTFLENGLITPLLSVPPTPFPLPQPPPTPPSPFPL